MLLYRSLFLFVAVAGVTSMPAFADETTTITSKETTQSVPAPAAAVTETKTTETTTTVTTKVDLNKATVKDLTRVQGVSLLNAKEILSYRKHNGDFKSVNDLKKVKGFKKLNDEKFNRIKDQFTAS